MKWAKNARGELFLNWVGNRYYGRGYARPHICFRLATRVRASHSMLTVTGLTLREIRLPLKEPFRTSTGTVTERRVLLVQLNEIDGAVGWGECVALEAPDYWPETIDTAWLMIRDCIGPRVLGRTFEGPEDVAALLEYGIRGHTMARAAVEMAMWELAARIKRLPLATLLGGTRDKVAAGIVLGIQEDPEALVYLARDAVDEGYQRIKLKIKPGVDIQSVRAVFAEAGSEVRLTVDANCAYALDDASHLAKLDEFGLQYIEQPLAWDDLVRHADLQRQIQTPICLDESITGVDRVEDMIRLGSGRIVNVKPGRVGGFSAALVIHELCAAQDVPVWCGGMLETGIGRAHNVALASLPGFTLAGDLSPSARYWVEDIVEPEWSMDDGGYVRVPLGEAGMGISVRTDRVEALTVRRETLTA